MKKVIIFLLIILLSASPALAGKHVKGYYRSDGTYVQSYTRSKPNHTTLDNYSTRGNINPYTGSYGTKNSNTYNYKKKLSKIKLHI
ncbi:MAG: hypothetical protein V2B14_01925 [bacterium]